MERVARDNDRVKTKTHGSRERVAEGRILTMLRLPSNTATPLPTSVRTINNGQNTPPSQSGAPESKGGTGKQAASSSNVARNFVRAHLAQVWPLRHGHDNDIADARLLLLGQSRSSSKPPPRLLTRRFEFEPRPTPDRIIRQQRTRISNAETSNLTPTTAAQTDVSDSAPPEGNEKCVLELESSGRTGEDITSPQHEDADATPVVVDSNVSSSHVDACESHPHRTRPSVATQCHLLDTITGKDEGEDLASRIADKYPIWIDISRSHGAKFLEIADFSMPLALRSDPVPVEIIVEPRRSDAQSNQEADKFDTLSPPGNDEELLGLLRGQILTPHRPDDKESCAAAEYRARYREHFARESGKVGLGSSAATGIESLLTLQGDMSKLRQRLSELEMCANAIDDEFQMSYHVSRSVRFETTPPMCC